MYKCDVIIIEYYHSLGFAISSTPVVAGTKKSKKE